MHIITSEACIMCQLNTHAGHDRYHHRAGFILAKAGLAAHIIDKEHGLAGSLFIPVVNE